MLFHSFNNQDEHRALGGSDFSEYAQKIVAGFKTNYPDAYIEWWMVRNL